MERLGFTGRSIDDWTAKSFGKMQKHMDGGRLVRQEAAGVGSTPKFTGDNASNNVRLL